MKITREKTNGITLIALIVTIIILLILAGVTIATLNENGLFLKAKIAKEKQTETEVKEKINLLVSEYAIEREQGKTLLQFLTEKKDSGEIDNFIDNNDGTFDIVINGYTTTINESDLSTTEPQILCDIMVTCLAKAFSENKVQALITVKSQSGGIKEIRLINNVIVQGNNKSSITFDQTIEANTEYQVEVELTNGATNTKTIKYEDTEAPTTIIEFSSNKVDINQTIEATITQEDKKSGVDISNCKYIINNTEDKIEVDSELWESAEKFTENPQKINIIKSDAGTYYIHILSKDLVGNKIETVSSGIKFVTTTTYYNGPYFGMPSYTAFGNYWSVNGSDTTTQLLVSAGKSGYIVSKSKKFFDDIDTLTFSCSGAGMTNSGVTGILTFGLVSESSSTDFIIKKDVSWSWNSYGLPIILDISNIKGEYYIKIILNTTSSSGQSFLGGNASIIGK